MRERFPDLEQFFGCYFHQDWKIEAEDDRGLVRLFLGTEPEGWVTGTRRELDEFLAEPLAEGELRAILLRSFGCYYDPAPDGLSMREWLGRIKVFLADG
jgi:CdiI immunity protein